MHTPTLQAVLTALAAAQGVDLAAPPAALLIPGERPVIATAEPGGDLVVAWAADGLTVRLRAVGGLWAVVGAGFGGALDAPLPAAAAALIVADLVEGWAAAARAQLIGGGA